MHNVTTGPGGAETGMLLQVGNPVGSLQYELSLTLA